MMMAAWMAAVLFLDVSLLLQLLAIVAVSSISLLSLSFLLTRLAQLQFITELLFASLILLKCSTERESTSQANTVKEEEQKKEDSRVAQFFISTLLGSL